jgi:hypothetical protein
MNPDYTKLTHRYLLETDMEDIFDSYKHDLPVILEFLQDNNEIKGYSLDNCAAMGSKGSGYNADGGFVKGRVTFKIDRYIDVAHIMTGLQDIGENKHDRN